jgi:hypothetical protein
VLTALSNRIWFGGWPQRHAQPHERTAAVAGRNPGRAAGLLGDHHLHLAGRRVGADVDLQPVGPAVGGGVVDQVLDRLAEHGRAGLDLGHPRQRGLVGRTIASRVAEHVARQLVQVIDLASSSSSDPPLLLLVGRQRTPGSVIPPI